MVNWCHVEEFLKIEAFLVLPGELVKQCQFVLMTNINNFKKYCLGNTMLFSNIARYIQMSSYRSVLMWSVWILKLILKRLAWKYSLEFDWWRQFKYYQPCRFSFSFEHFGWLHRSHKCPGYFTFTSRSLLVLLLLHAICAPHRSCFC